MTESLIYTTVPKPFGAAKDAAARYGIDLPDVAAEAIARAALECADDQVRVACEVSAEVWDYPSTAEAVDRNLRRRMADELAEAKVLPTALPRQVVTHPPVRWGPVKVELVVPVRYPLSDEPRTRVVGR